MVQTFCVGKTHPEAHLSEACFELLGARDRQKQGSNGVQDLLAEAKG